MSTLVESPPRIGDTGARFTHLVASGKHRAHGWTSRSTLLSIAAHGVLLAGVVYLSVTAPPAVASEEELITLFDIAPKPAEPEVEKEAPKPEPPKPVSEAPPVPKGTQALVAPEEAPPVIPEVDLSQPAVNVDDFSGMGVVGGRADGAEGVPLPEVEPAAPATEFAYEPAVLERQPELLNASAIAKALERLYPPLLRAAGLGGSVTMQFVITPEGRVDSGSVKVLDTPHDLLSAASVEATERLRFRPGRYKGENVRVLIQMPITWTPPR